MKNSLDIEVTRPDDVLIIMRGIPGAGKSTEATKQVGNGIIHSTDAVIEASFDYRKFFDEMIESKDFSNLSRMHALNYKNAKASIDAGISPVVIDNTNIKANEPKKYVVYALKKGYADENIKFVDIGNGGCTAEELAERNTHGVPLDKIKSMMQSHKSVGELTLTKVLSAKDMFATKSARISFIKLDDKSKKKLITALDSNIPKGWDIHAHHMTIQFGKSLTKEEKEDLGKKVELRVTHIGRGDKVVAVKVHGYRSKNKVPHITLAVDPLDGKAVMSNDIKDWFMLDSFINVTGTVEETLPFQTPTTTKV